jgi:hypothetical protein
MDRTRVPGRAEPPPTLIPLLGWLGVVGGLALVLAFVPGLPWNGDVFNLRLVAFNAGAIAIALATQLRATATIPPALVGTVPVIAANMAYLAMVIRLVAQPGEPGPGDYGPWFDVATTLLWLGDAWFGIVVAWFIPGNRSAGAVLAVGSVLAWNGPSRLGLVSGDVASIVAVLSLLGILMSGIAWMGLGFDLVRRRRAVATA